MGELTPKPLTAEERAGQLKVRQQLASVTGYNLARAGKQLHAAVEAGVVTKEQAFETLIPPAVPLPSDPGK